MKEPWNDGPPAEASLRREIAAERYALGRSVEELERELKAAFDWRDQVERHKVALAAGAVGLGLFLAYRRRRRSPERQVVAAIRGVSREAAEAFSAITERLAPRRPNPLVRAVVLPLVANAFGRWFTDPGPAPRPREEAAGTGRQYEDTKEDTWNVERPRAQRV
jgi:hypothetical protein